MREDKTYVAYEQEERFWAENEKTLKKEYPNKWLVISGSAVVLAADDYFEAAQVLDSWPRIAIIESTGPTQTVAHVPHIRAGV